MSKVIIDGNLIDLEMITHIENVQTYYDEAFFIIHLVGCDRIQIRRFYGTSWRNELLPGNKEYNDNIDKARKKRDTSIEAVSKMHDELVKRWSPNTMKFDDLTVK